MEQDGADEHRCATYSELLVSLVGDLVGRVLDGDFGFANRFLDVALGCLCGTLRAEPIVADRLVNTLLYLAYGFVGMSFDLVGCAAHVILLGLIVWTVRNAQYARKVTAVGLGSSTSERAPEPRFDLF
jgi:hypothetical protein